MKENEVQASIFSAAQEQELVRLKQYMPYRIVWGCVNTQTEPHEFEAHADYNRRKLNAKLRAGWLVATVGE
jgi:hypothetical protein